MKAEMFLEVQSEDETVTAASMGLRMKAEMFRVVLQREHGQERRASMGLRMKAEMFLFWSVVMSPSPWLQWGSA